MKSREFEEVIEKQMEMCFDILIEKAKEYADNGDRLHNFKYAGNLQGINPVKALSGMMAKHTISIYDMCGSEALHTREMWDEKITDSINYLLLLKALLIDEDLFLNTPVKKDSITCSALLDKNYRIENKNLK